MTRSALFLACIVVLVAFFFGFQIGGIGGLHECIAVLNRPAL